MNDLNSELNSFADGMEGTTLAFAASSNCSYAIEGCESLSSSNAWNTLTNNLPGIDGIISLPNTEETTNRFFRLKASRQ